MSNGEFLEIQPSELKFQFELRKLSSCSMQSANKTDQSVAFKVYILATNPKKYCVRPNAAIVLPKSMCSVTVIMQAPTEGSTDMQCTDKFIVQSVIAPTGVTNKADVTKEMFNREDVKVVDEVKMRVVYIPANPPSPVPEGDKEGTSPGTSLAENELSEAVGRLLKQAMENSSCEKWEAVVSKLNEEKASVRRQNQKLLTELELIRKQIGQGLGGVYFVVLLLCLILGMLLGYLIKK